MADHSAIEWTDATWNPVTGCSVVSPGCTNCYAMRLAGARMKQHPSREGLTTMTKAGPVWNGQVRLNEGWLAQPLTWKRPRRIFVCAHGDLFHESVPDAWIDRVFAVMALAPRHTFQVLTKRSARMRAYMTDPGTPGRIARAVLDMWIDGGIPKDLAGADDWPVQSIGDPEDPDDVTLRSWPLPNVWLGVSAEDQERADQRIPDLLATPAAIRFVSLEPLLGPIDLDFVPWPLSRPRFPETDDLSDGRHALSHRPGPNIDWVIAGGESGPGARPSHPDWFRALRDQCRAAGVPFFFKQWGEWAPTDYHGCIEKFVFLDGRHGGFHELGSTMMQRIGKDRAGRTLDGRTHDDYPEAK